MYYLIYRHSFSAQQQRLPRQFRFGIHFSLINFIPLIYFPLDFLNNHNSNLQRCYYSLFFSYSFKHLAYFFANLICKIQAAKNADIQPNLDSTSDGCTNQLTLRQTSVLNKRVSIFLTNIIQRTLTMQTLIS